MKIEGESDKFSWGSYEDYLGSLPNESLYESSNNLSDSMKIYI